MARMGAWKVLKIIGYPLVFLAAFALFLVWTFPVERFVGVAEQQLGAMLGRKVKIADIDMSPTGTVVLTGVEIEVPPPEEDAPSASRFSLDEETQAEEKDAAPQPKLSYVFEEIAIDVSLLSLMGGGLEVAVETEAFGGELELSYDGPIPSGKKERPGRHRRMRRPVRSPEEENSEGNSGEEDKESRPLNIGISAEGLELRQIHDLRGLMPLPITGTVRIETELTSATGKLSELAGKAAVGIQGLVLSRKDYQAEMFGMQMQVPPLAISSTDFVMEFEDGKGKIEKLDVKSKHLALEMAGDIELADPFERSRVDFYLMFKVLEDYMASSDAVRTIMSQVDMFSSDMKRAHRDDGFYGFRYRGLWKTAKMRPSKRGPDPDMGKGKSAKRKNTRPSIRRPTRRPRPSARPSRDRAERPVPASLGSPTLGNRPSLPPPRARRREVDTEAHEPPPEPPPDPRRESEFEEEMVFEDSPPDEILPEDELPPDEDIPPEEEIVDEEEFAEEDLEEAPPEEIPEEELE